MLGHATCRRPRYCRLLSGTGAGDEKNTRSMIISVKQPKGQRMNPTTLDPLIEGYLDYQLKVRRLAIAARGYEVHAQTRRHSVGAYASLVPLWKLTLEIIWLG